MKKTITILGLLVALGFAETMPNTFSAGESISAAKINENFTYLLSKANSLTSKSFIGVSTQTHDGDDGVMAMNQSCNQSFLGSTMCTTEDILNSTNDSLAGSGYAWVIAISKAAYSDIDISGAYLSNGGSCIGWTNTTDSSAGTVVSLPGGGIKGGMGCDVARPVACCR
jgi:hypothetical protein